jgi:ribosomal protein S27AE
MRIDPIEQDGWDYFEDPPDWVVDAARRKGIHEGPAGREYIYEHFYGDNYVYKAVSSVHGNVVHVFSKLKSEHFQTDNESGTCPNCQQYIRRLDGDDRLTCHDCGWTYKSGWL